jgi:hypothetical protein
LDLDGRANGRGGGDDRVRVSEVILSEAKDLIDLVGRPPAR